MNVGSLVQEIVDPAIYVNKDDKPNQDHFGLSIKQDFGDSGGIIADLSGNIMGILMGGLIGRNFASAVKSRYVLPLVEAYTRHFKK